MTAYSLSERYIVISGATSDIGKALCKTLASTRATLVLIAHRKNKLERVAEELEPLTNNVEIYPTDLTSQKSIQNSVAQLRKKTDQVDVIIHCAGTFEMGSFSTAPIADLDTQYETNVRGAYLLTQSLLPLLIAAPGQVVFLNSTVGLDARKEVGQYAATQHALRAMADSLRAEINSDGVRVLSVYLGRTATARQERIFKREGRDYHPELLIQPDDVANMVEAALKLPLTAEVTEIRMRPRLKSY